MKKALSFALAFVCFVTLVGVDFVDVASADTSVGPAKTYYYKWKRVRSDNELYSYMGKSNSDSDNESGYNHRMLILYGNDMSKPNYRWTGTDTNGSNRTMYGVEISAVDGIDITKDEFQTISNFNAPMVKYGGVNRFNDPLTCFRFSNERTTYDSTFAIASKPERGVANPLGGYLESLVSISKTKLFVYSCKVLYGGVQSASFYSKLVPTKWDEPDTSGAYKDQPARMFAHRLEWLSNGRCVITTERKNLLDATLEHDGSSIEYNYYDTKERSQFIIYVSTLVEVPAICSDDTYKNYTTTIIDGLLIKPAVTLTVKDGATLKLSGNVTNNGCLVIGDGGTVVLDYGAFLSTDPAAKAERNGNNTKIYPGSIKIQNGGQLIILEKATCSIPYIEGNTTTFKVEKGGTLYVAGNLYCAETMDVDGGQFIITKNGTYRQGYAKYGDQIISNPKQYLYITDGSMLEFESSGKNGQYMFACSFECPYDGDNFKYKKLGGIIFRKHSGGNYYFYDGSTCPSDSMSFSTGNDEVDAALEASSASGKTYGPVYNNEFTSGKTKYQIEHRLTWSTEMTNFFMTAVAPYLMRGTYESDCTNGGMMVSTTGKVFPASQKDECIRDAFIDDIMVTNNMTETAATLKYNEYKEEYEKAADDAKGKTTYAKTCEQYSNVCNPYYWNGDMSETIPESERGAIDLGCDGQEGGC